MKQAAVSRSGSALSPSKPLRRQVKTSVAVLSALLLPLLGGCGSDDSSGGVDVPSIPADFGSANSSVENASALQSTWQQPCHALAGNLSIERTLILGETSVELQERGYLDNNCTTPDTTLVRYGAYQIGGNIDVGTDTARQFEVIFDRAESTAHSESVVTIRNESTICDRSDWQQNVAVDVSDFNACSVIFPLALRQEQRFYVLQARSSGGLAQFDLFLDDRNAFQPQFDNCRYSVSILPGDLSCN